jgi:hypothetical protein
MKDTRIQTMYEEGKIRCHHMYTATYRDENKNSFKFTTIRSFSNTIAANSIRMSLDELKKTLTRSTKYHYFFGTPSET